MQICKNAKIENANLMKCKFGKLQICKNKIWKNGNKKKLIAGKKEIVKMDIRKNDIWGNWENCKFGKM